MDTKKETSKGFVIGLTVWLILVATTVVAFSKEYSVSDWFALLKTPVAIDWLPANQSCCDQADCKQRQVRINYAGLMEAWIEEAGNWAVVPPETKITDPEVLVNNPFFQRVVCYVPTLGVICYVDGNAGG
jgi:hypothetical protein